MRNKSLAVTCGMAFLGILGTSYTSCQAATPDHQEFEAMLQAPFAPGSDGARVVRLHFSYPGEQETHHVHWQLDLLGPQDRVLEQWQGEQPLVGAPLEVAVNWRADATLAKGVYQLRLRAGVDDAQPQIEQRWDVGVGLPKATPAIHAIAPMMATAVKVTANAMPYTIYLGNLHSQTNHSDGGGTLARCTGAQAPQSAALGPSDAYAYAAQHGLDFLMTSEHNHMYDGSDGTNPNADPEAVRALYQNGLQQAADWNRIHPSMLALYGQEWGVINNGGHLNILDSDELLGWERNAGGALLAGEETPKNDYAALYALLRARGWTGQFNHPQGGQFAIAGQGLAWSADGDAAMALCEVMNSNAFSTSMDESETRHGNYEPACKALLEAGYHIAFSSNQDNHCANWGASYGNRTGVLLPAGAPLTRGNLLAAIKARRVYATMDKHARLVLTANGHIMGERFSNQGQLTLEASYASDNGHGVATLTIFHGVPGGAGSIAALINKASSTITPPPGEHFYYARVTQDDGKIVWSAPVWVSQSAP